MYKNMTEDQVYDFIRNNTLTAHVATVRKDGTPHVAPVWVTVDGKDIVFQTARDTVKGRTLLRTGYCALSMDDSTPPFNSVRVEGTVTFDEDPAALKHWATVIGGRYMGEDKAELYGERNGVPPEMVVRLTPTKLSGLVGVADFHDEDEA